MTSREHRQAVCSRDGLTHASLRVSCALSFGQTMVAVPLMTAHERLARRWRRGGGGGLGLGGRRRLWRQRARLNWSIRALVSPWFLPVGHARSSARRQHERLETTRGGQCTDAPIEARSLPPQSPPPTEPESSSAAASPPPPAADELARCRRATHRRPLPNVAAACPLF